MQVSAKLRSSNRTIFLNKRHAAEKNGKIHAARPPTVLYRRASEKIVVLLDFSFAETCISGILSSQKSLLPSSMHKHVDHGPRLSGFFCEQASLLNFMIRVAIQKHLLYC